MNYSSIIPASTKEWILYALILVCLIWIYCQNKALLKCKDIIHGYVEEIRLAKLEKEKGKQGVIDEFMDTFSDSYPKE